jgi:hypothetical protein
MNVKATGKKVAWRANKSSNTKLARKDAKYGKISN